MTEFQFRDKPTITVKDPESAVWAQAILDETYRNYMRQSPKVGSLDQLSRDPDSYGLPKMVEVLADVSGSMSQQLHGECKLDMFKLIMLNSVNRIIADMPVGARTMLMMRVIGQSSMDVSDCQKTELVLGPGRIRDIEHYKAYVDKVLSLRAGGITPLTFALMQTDNDLFKYAPYSCSREIIYATDGIETRSCINNMPNSIVQGAILKRKGVIINIPSLGLAKDKDALEELGKIASPGQQRNIERLPEVSAKLTRTDAGPESMSKHRVYSNNGQVSGDIQATTKVEGKVMLPSKRQ